MWTETKCDELPLGKLKSQGQFSIPRKLKFIWDTIWYQAPYYWMKLRLAAFICSHTAKSKNWEHLELQNIGQDGWSGQRKLRLINFWKVLMGS